MASFMSVKKPGRPSTSLSRAPFRFAWLALALGAAASCGGTNADDDGSGGNPGTGGEDGASAGGGGAGDGSGGLNASGGTDGDPSGGAPSGGAPTGGTGGEPAMGGLGGWGGDSGSEHLVDLGDSCDTPGIFACSAANEALALICSGDGEWEVLEACEVGEVCDSVNDATAGMCRMVLEECETGSDEPFCGDAGIEACLPGGFETEVLEACEETDICLLSGCIAESDACPSASEDVYGCEGDCTPLSTGCGHGADCFRGMMLMIDDNHLADARIARLPDEMPCEDGYVDCSDGDSFQIIVDSLFSPDVPETWIRVTMEPGWEMRAYYDDDSGAAGCRGEHVQECLILPPPVGDGAASFPGRIVNFYPITDPPVGRNVLFEVVDPGTTCP